MRCWMAEAQEEVKETRPRLQGKVLQGKWVAA